MRSVSALIQTELEDVIHKKGRGWRHIICALWTAPVFRFALDGTAWGLVTDTFTFNFTWSFLTTSPLKTTECVLYQDEKLPLAGLSRYLVFKTLLFIFYCVCRHLTASILVELLSVAHFV